MSIPEHLLRRSAEAKAKATGRSVEEVLAEMTGEEPPAPAEEAAAAPPTAAASLSGADLAAAAAATSGMPEKLLMRSAEAKAKASGRTVDEVLAEMAGVTPSAPAADSPAPAVAAAAAAAPAAAAPAAIPEGVRAQRLLTVVRAAPIQQVKGEPQDKVAVWPHLLGIEFVALLVVTAGLVIFSVFVNAPLLELANFNEQPNPSKAPWYFLGLQEVLSYFDPQVAGVLLPGLGLAGMAAIPYIDRNPSTRPSDRKLAIMIFTFFLMAAALLTIFGSFFRGPGFNFTFPWNSGLFFDF
ncbi:MAG: menaquinol-cytochrome c reductase cytochrome b subunit [Acidimicrobiia bacterium]